MLEYMKTTISKPAWREDRGSKYNPNNLPPKAAREYLRIALSFTYDIVLSPITLPLKIIQYFLYPIELSRFTIIAAAIMIAHMFYPLAISSDSSFYGFLCVKLCILFDLNSQSTYWNKKHKPLSRNLISRFQLLVLFFALGAQAYYKYDYEHYIHALEIAAGLSYFWFLRVKLSYIYTGDRKKKSKEVAKIDESKNEQSLLKETMPTDKKHQLSHSNQAEGKGDVPKQLSATPQVVEIAPPNEESSQETKLPMPESNESSEENSEVDIDEFNKLRESRAKKKEEKNFHAFLDEIFTPEEKEETLNQLKESTGNPDLTITDLMNMSSEDFMPKRSEGDIYDDDKVAF